MSYEVFESLVSKIDPALLGRSGAVFYSGVEAFSRQSDLYILGLNPGGSLERHQHFTVERNIAHARAVPSHSAYESNDWESEHMQRRMRHLLHRLEKEFQLRAANIPASNLIFVRTPDEASLSSDKKTLIDECWPFHEGVIQRLGVRVVVALGQTAGASVRDRLGGPWTEAEGPYTEDNRRRWTSTSCVNRERGIGVVTLTHPSRADWTSTNSDPTDLVVNAIRRARAAKNG